MSNMNEYQPDPEIELHAWLLTRGLSMDDIKKIPQPVLAYLYKRLLNNTIGFTAEALHKYRILNYIKSSVLATKGVESRDSMVDILPEEEPFLRIKGGFRIVGESDE